MWPLVVFYKYKCTTLFKQGTNPGQILLEHKAQLGLFEGAGLWWPTLLHSSCEIFFFLIKKQNARNIEKLSSSALCCTMSEVTQHQEH